MMHAFAAALLTVALGFPPPWHKQPVESRAEYETRLLTITRAIALETRDRQTAAMTLVVLYEESRFRRDVHSGKTLGDEGRAACLGQLHQSSLIPRARWERLTGVGLEATRRCVGATIRVLLAQQRLCRARGQPGTAETLAAYATGVTCEPGPRSRRRAAMVHRLLRRL